MGRRGGPEFLDSELARLEHLLGLAITIARSLTSSRRPSGARAQATDLIRVTKTEPRRHVTKPTA